MLLAVYPRGNLEGLIQGEEIFSSCSAYFRSPYFSFHKQGQIGFAPRSILLEEDEEAELVKSFAGFDPHSDPLLEAKIYKGLTLKDVDVVPFLESANTCLVELKPQDRLRIELCYRFGENTPKISKTMKTKAAISAFNWMYDNTQAQFDKDSQSRFMYECLKNYEGDGELFLILSTKNGGLVLNERWHGLGGIKKRVIDRYETISVNDPDLKINASLIKIPKLDKGHSTFITDSGIVLKYCKQMVASNEDIPYGNELKQIRYLNTLEGAIQMALCEGRTYDFESVGVKDMVGLTTITDSSNEGLNRLYLKLKQTYEPTIRQRDNNIVGIGIYDPENKVAHLKIDSEFEHKAGIDGIFYDAGEENPFYDTESKQVDEE